MTVDLSNIAEPVLMSIRRLSVAVKTSPGSSRFIPITSHLHQVCTLFLRPDIIYEFRRREAGRFFNGVKERCPGVEANF